MTNSTMRSEAGAAGPVVLRAVANRCSASDCPTVYVTNRDTVVVQGYLLRPQDVGITVPDGEMLVEIPAGLLTTAVESISRQ